MLANESDFELHFSLNWEEKQFKSIFQEKEDSGSLLYFVFLYRSANFKAIMTPLQKWNWGREQVQDAFNVGETEYLDLVASSESNSRL